MVEQNPNLDHPVVYFDGYCNLCNGAIQWIIGRDQHQLFYFAPLTGQYASQTLPHPLLTNVDSIVLQHRGQVFIKSTAALEIARLLPYPYRLLSAFRIIPPLLRDALYDLVARYRYRIWGKQTTCMKPSTDIKSRFLD